MSQDVGRVTTSIASAVDEVKKLAGDVHNEVEVALAEVRESLSMAKDFAGTFRSEAQKLRSFLAPNTNNAPVDPTKTG